MATLRIDGVEHRAGALTVLRRDERLPGGIRFSLDLDRAVIVQHFARGVPLRTGHTSPREELQLFALLRRILSGARAPARFCVATLDHVEVHARSVRFSGRCAPLAAGSVAPHSGMDFVASSSDVRTQGLD
ncbi:MAG TPA: hypothetical protein VEB19_07825 [Gemmatimonadaceae bacterium]|nr:hypothetical protein [Gemmatimonadaceae bacterium]